MSEPSEYPTLDEVMALGGFIDTVGFLLVLVPDESVRDSLGQPMYGIFFLPPRTKLRVVERRGGRMTLKILGCDWDMGEEARRQFNEVVVGKECVTGEFDLRKAL